MADQLSAKLRDLESAADTNRKWLEQYDTLVELAGELMTSRPMLSGAVTAPKAKRVTRTQNGSARKRRKAHMRRSRTEGMNDVLHLLRTTGEVVPVRDAQSFGRRGSRQFEYYRASMSREAGVLVKEGKVEVFKTQLPGTRGTVQGYRVKAGITL